MKIGIIYYSKTGTVLKCANIIKDKVNGELLDLKNDKFNLNDYDFLIIGSAFRMFNIPKAIKKFFKANLNDLIKKQYALFFCGLSDNAEVMYNKYIDPEIIKNSLKISYFNGELNEDKAKGFEKFMIKSMIKSYIDKKVPLPSISMAKIDDFCDEINKIINKPFI